MAAQTFQQEYMQMPSITRSYTTACVLTTLAVQLDIITPFQIYFNPELILRNYQLWRLVTNFMYFGPIGFNFLFNLIFTYRYCRMLEEGSFRGRTADFFFMFVFGGTLMTIVALFVNLVFLGSAFTIMLVYVWSRRNPYIRMNFFGLMTFQAPYLPWVLLGFSLLLGNPVIVDLMGSAFTIMLVYVWSRRNPYIRMNFFGLMNFQAPYLPWVLLGFSLLLGNPVIVDLMGIAVGHVYYFLEDIFPEQPGGFKLLKTPRLLKRLIDSEQDDPNYNPLPEERPGGFNWGEHQ